MLILLLSKGGNGWLGLLGVAGGCWESIFFIVIMGIIPYLVYVQPTFSTSHSIWKIQFLLVLNVGNTLTQKYIKNSDSSFDSLKMFDSGWLPSGKHTKNYGTSPRFMGNFTISMAIFNSYVTNYQRVYIPISVLISH